MGKQRTSVEAPVALVDVYAAGDSVGAKLFRSPDPHRLQQAARALRTLGNDLVAGRPTKCPLWAGKRHGPAPFALVELRQGPRGLEGAISPVPKARRSEVGRELKALAERWRESARVLREGAGSPLPPVPRLPRRRRRRAERQPPEVPAQLPEEEPEAARPVRMGRAIGSVEVR